MSSGAVPKVSRLDVLRGSTFRRIFLGLLALWAIFGGALAGFEHRVRKTADAHVVSQADSQPPPTLQEPRQEARPEVTRDFIGFVATEESEDAIREWVEESEDEAFHELVGEDFYDEPLDLEIEEDLSGEEFHEEYIAALEELLEEGDLDDEERYAVLARLAILGVASDEIPDVLEEPAALAYVGWMFDEIPEHLHDYFDEVGADVLEAWEESEELLLEERIEDLIRRLEEIPPVVTESAEIPTSPAPTSRSPTSPTQVASSRPSAPSTAEIMSPATRSMVFWRNLLLPFGLLFAFVAAYLAARPTAQHLQRLEQAEARLSEGDFRTRLRAPADPDLRAATSAINAMLEQLEHSVAGLTQVTDDIAHDLRTPLTRLQGQLDLLKQSPTPELISAVQIEADQLIATFNALLRIAQVESGSRRGGFRDFDMARVVADVAELYEPVFADKEQTFRWTSDGSWTCRGDRDLWMQAFSNLLDNALKYTPEGGTIELIWNGGGRRLTVRDSGPGIPEGERDNVFRRFYRLQRHRGQRGNGLGLSLVKAICDLHQATIELEHVGGLQTTIRWPSRVPSRRAGRSLNR